MPKPVFRLFACDYRMFFVFLRSHPVSGTLQNSLISRIFAIYSSTSTRQIAIRWDFRNFSLISQLFALKCRSLRKFFYVLAAIHAKSCENARKDAKVICDVATTNCEILRNRRKECESYLRSCCNSCEILRNERKDAKIILRHSDTLSQSSIFTYKSYDQIL